ncbi:MAG: hypothetical protein K2I42_03295 [Anaeroplasmataceae bacterium]|nr:hypothetical protein [Anaeroplasmataceae bacterium]
MYQIHNNIFRLSISEFGAELEELCVKDINILWKRNSLWKNQSPILFPIIGNLKDGYFIYQGKKYELDAHGFLQHQVFEVENHTSDSITFSSKSTEDTLKMYPFHYKFLITYKLICNRVLISFEIQNLGNDLMYFSIGFHPGFDYEGIKHLLGENVELNFKNQNVKTIFFNPKYINKIEEKRIDSTISLSNFSKELIQQRTLCYGLNQVDIQANSNILRIQHNMPFTAFWQSEPENPQFLCVEPWYGLPDEEQSNHQLIDKKYIQIIQAKNTFKTQIEVDFLEGEYNANNKM